MFVNGWDVSAYALLDHTEIVKDSTESVSTARVTFWRAPNELAQYDAAGTVYDTATYDFTPIEWQELELKDQSGNKQFAGYITQLSRKVLEGNKTHMECTAADYGILLDRAILNYTYVNSADSDIFEDCISRAGVTGVTVDGTDITTIVADMGTVEAKDISVRQLLTDVCDLTGGSWRVDYDRALHYYRAGTTDAPFALVDAENANGTTLVEHFLESLDTDFAAAANRIVVLGGLTDGGAEITSTQNNYESQAKYGVLSATVVDRGIADQASADLRAQAEIAQRAFPLVSGTATVWKDGLDIGQTLSVTNAAYGVSESFLISSITIKQVHKSVGGIDESGKIYCVYTVDFGEKVPDLVTQIRRMQQKPKQPTTAPVARPAPGSITEVNFASTIAAVHIVDAKPVGAEWNDYEEGALFLLTTDRKLYRRSGDDWTAEVATIDLEGQITETQITDGAISTPKLQALAITAEKMAANSVIAGKIATDAVIAGTVAAGAIRASDAAFDAAAIQSADIASLTANKLTAGTIDASVISVVNVNASNITVGSMSGTRLADGTVADIKISSGLSATKITTGTLDANVISVVNLNASNITTGTLSANRIGAGTISASVTMSSPVITGGSITLSQGTGDTTEINLFGTQVRRTSDATTRAIVTATSFIVNTSGTTRLTLTGATGAGALYLYDTSGANFIGIDPFYGTSSSAGPGGAALPSNPVGFLIVVISGVQRKIPYYA